MESNFTSMKSITVIVIACLLLFSCSDEIAKPNADSLAIQAYMDTTLNDIKSYEPLSYEQVDSTEHFRVIKHRFRADNKLNGTLLATWCFRIGKDGKVIDASEESTYLLARRLQDSIFKADSILKASQ